MTARDRYANRPKGVRLGHLETGRIVATQSMPEPH